MPRVQIQGIFEVRARLRINSVLERSCRCPYTLDVRGIFCCLLMRWSILSDVQQFNLTELKLFLNLKVNLLIVILIRVVG